MARLTAGSLAAAIASADPARHRDELVTRALQLRTETVEAAALPGAGPAAAASWTYTAAAEDLIRALAGPAGQREAGHQAGLAAQLRAIEEHCTPDGTTNADPPRAPVTATRAGIDVARMTTAIALLHRQGAARS